MIKNEKEFRTTRTALTGFEKAIADFDVIKIIQSGVDPLIAKMQLASYQRQAAELRSQIEAYEKIRAGLKPTIELDAISELGRGLIEARLARGLTQRELANLTGCQEQQVQRYEKDSYASASLKRIEQLAAALGINFKGTLSVTQSDNSSNGQLPHGFSLSDFPFAEMNKRGWFGAPDVLRRAPPAVKASALNSFFALAPVEARQALHRKTSGAVSTQRSAALLAWQARILMKAQQKTGLARHFSPPPAEVVAGLAKLSAKPTGVVDAIELLLSYGIIVVFERHLQKTKLDGAAMCLENGKFAVIGLTTRHDRIDNFWFVLLHEIGHLMMHWPEVVRSGIVDENAGEDSKDVMENEADEFANNAIFPKVSWQSSLVRFSKQSDSIRAFAERHGLHPALIAGRIRRERDYTEFHDLLGHGEIRSALEEAGYLEKENGRI